MGLLLTIQEEVVMGTSEKYIKMCEKAIEIQIISREKDKKAGIINLPENEETWLPHQDQLQEMICDSRDALTLFCNTHSIVCFEWKYYEQFTVMEQLWLAFVMKEKYNKIWNGEDWEEV